MLKRRIPVSKHSLFKYLPNTQRVDALLGGEIFCQSLRYFQLIEDGQVRGDTKEGTSVFEPPIGLAINKLTNGESFILKDHRFESAANTDHIYAFCMGTSLNDQLAKEFKAVACVEILDIQKFCTLATRNLAPDFSLPTVDKKPRIGHRVRYYDPAEPPSTRWALPELIAISKRKCFSWQEEFRLVFGKRTVFDFMNAKYELKTGETGTSQLASTSPPVVIQIGNIESFSKVHCF